MIRSFFFLLVIALLVSCGDKETTPARWVVSSPKGTLHVITHRDSQTGEIFYQVQRMEGSDTLQVLERSPLGLTLADQSLAKNLAFVEAGAIRLINDTYTMTSGKQRTNTTSANELTLTFKNEQATPLQITFRVYDDGLAFRYTLLEPAGRVVTITSEHSGFKLPSKGRAWLQHYDSITKYTPAYEQYYTNGVALGTSSVTPHGWCFPGLFQVEAGWLMITESNHRGNYFGAHFNNDAGSSLYFIEQPEATEVHGAGTTTGRLALPWNSPWRVVMVGSTVSEVITSNVVHHVADDPSSNDFEWVKPGRASWSWWSDQDSPRNFNSLKEFIDFSAEMGWEYSLVDANWNEMKGGTIEELVKYASTKNVGIWLWYNSGGPHNVITEQPRDIMSDSVMRKEEMKRIQTLGVKGIKVDFFQSDKQFIMQHYINILRDAATNQLLINFHGCTIPRGWQRTWPNLLSMESTRGLESYIFAKEFPARAPLHNVHLAFTRNVVGSMDYTPIGFSDNNYPHITTNAHELALGIIFESGIQHPSDAAASYRNQPLFVKKLLSEIPVVWDEIKFLSGSPDMDILLARRKGTEWYVGYINGLDEKMEVSLDFYFLNEGEYAATIIRDGNHARDFSTENAVITNADVKVITTLPYGGFVIKLVSLSSKV